MFLIPDFLSTGNCKEINKVLPWLEFLLITNELE